MHKWYYLFALFCDIKLNRYADSCYDDYDDDDDEDDKYDSLLKNTL